MVKKADAAATPPTDDKPLIDPNHPFNGADPDNPMADIDPDTGKKREPAQKKVKVKVGDTELETDESSAAVINALNKQTTDLYAYLKGITNGQPAAKPAVKDDKKADYDWETELFVNPKEALSRLRAEIKAEVKEEMTGAYNAAESSKQFWTAFYNDHADLKEHDFYVRAILQRDYAQLENMPASEGATELAKRVKKELLKMSGGKSNSDEEHRPLEGGSTRANAKSASQKPEDVVPSIGELIRRRQAGRRAATFSKE